MPRVLPTHPSLLSILKITTIVIKEREQRMRDKEARRSFKAKGSGRPREVPGGGSKSLGWVYCGEEEGPVTCFPGKTLLACAFPLLSHFRRGLAAYGACCKFLLVCVTGGRSWRKPSTAQRLLCAVAVWK